MKIGVMFGNPETTTGGNALKFYSSVRLDIRRIESIKEGQEVDRQPRAREGGEEQDGAAVQAGGVRHHVCARDFEDRRTGGSRGREESGGEVRGLVFLSGRAARAGTRCGARFFGTNQPLAREIEAKLRELAGVPGYAAEKEKPAAAPAKEERREDKKPHKVGV